MFEKIFSQIAQSEIYFHDIFQFTMRMENSADYFPLSCVKKKEKKT